MLGSIPLFDTLSAKQLYSLAAEAHEKTYQKGEVILREGEVADSLFVIRTGQVKVYSVDVADAAREIIYKMLSPGDFFGEIPMFDQAARSANVAALNTCRVHVLSYAGFQNVIAGSPDIAYRVMERMAKRLRDADRKIGTLALLDISARVSRTLLELAIMSNGRRVVGEPFTQKDLASMIGASREMVNRTLKDLSDGGFIHVERQSITILDENFEAQ